MAALYWQQTGFGVSIVTTLGLHANLHESNLDLKRASWIIEAILEVQAEKKGGLPDEWIAGVTKGLFDLDRHKASDDDALQAIAALVSFSASVQEGPDGFQIQLDKKNARRLSREIRSPKDNADK